MSTIPDTLGDHARYAVDVLTRWAGGRLKLARILGVHYNTLRMIYTGEQGACKSSQRKIDAILPTALAWERANGRRRSPYKPRKKPATILCDETPSHVDCTNAAISPGDSSNPNTTPTSTGGAVSSGSDILQ